MCENYTLNDIQAVNEVIVRQLQTNELPFCAAATSIFRYYFCEPALVDTFSENDDA